MSKDYDEQLAEKVVRMGEMFAEFGNSGAGGVLPEMEVFESEPVNYRMRAEFRVWHDGDDLYYIMFDQATRERVRVDEFPAASAGINALMPVLMEKLRDGGVLRQKVFQVDFLSTLSGEMLVSLLYHRQLDEEWEMAVRELKAELLECGFDVDFIGRARKQKFVVGREHVVERLMVHGDEYVYMQVENSFTQPNGRVAEKMLEWAVDATRGCEGDLLELYCGNGNFSLALAQNFRKVLATELAKPSVESAQWNIAANVELGRKGASEVKIARLSAEDFTRAMRGEREFKRLQQQEIVLEDYDFRTVFVDPPRAGMDADSVAMVQEYERIVYISCDPETLCENLRTLCETHEIVKLAMFDQFPYTHHIEAGVVLVRRR
jgi:tRNA (uracil-5-)-methyltransferase